MVHSHLDDASTWINVISDGIIATAYYAIPCMLLYFVTMRPDFPFRRMFCMFGAFIISCGTTHLVGMVHHKYVSFVLLPLTISRGEGCLMVLGLTKLVTALISGGTAVALWILLPEALKIPSPQHIQYSVRESNF